MLDQKNKVMSIPIAKHNFKLLSSQFESKLIVDKNTLKLNLDNRWFQGPRRFLSGDTRHDILTPIELTFERCMESYSDIFNCIQHLQDSLKNIYPSYTKLHNLLRELHYKYSRTVNISVLNKLKIPEHFIESPNDFIVLVPSDIGDWGTEIKIKSMKNWEFAYISPLSDNPNMDTVTLGCNNKYANTTQSLGNVKYINIHDAAKKLPDGNYDVRYNGLKNQTLLRFTVECHLPYIQQLIS